jgi:hypothetical protein
MHQVGTPRQCDAMLLELLSSVTTVELQLTELVELNTTQLQPILTALIAGL